MGIEQNLSVVVLLEKKNIERNMKKQIGIVFIMILTTGIMDAQQKMIADNEKTILLWLGEKVVGQHTGTIRLRDGWLTMKDNRIISGEFIIDMASLKDDDSNEKLESHLKSDDFFGVTKFPVSKLIIRESDSFEKGSANVRGDLTIKGITHPLEFRASLQKKEDGTWFYSNIVVDRTKYNVRYGSGTFFENLGDRTIYDEFKLKVSLLVR